MNGQQEKSSLLREQNGRGGHYFNVALSQQRQRPKKIWTLHNLIYICGLYILFSKTKSRCTPPKTFQLEIYTTPPSSNTVNESSTTTTTTTRIPKIIHQSYKSLSTLPSDWADTPSRWQTLHPTYEYKFWSDDDNRNLIAQHYPWFLNTYDNYPAPIQRADAARYFAVLHYGGIYADMDILPIRNVDPLLYTLDLPENNNKQMLVAETYNLGLTNALFASTPNSTILRQFVREELPTHASPLRGFEVLLPHFAVLLSTGPTRLWIYLNRGHRDEILTLNPAGWGQCHQCKSQQRRGKCVPQEGSFFETRRGGSWHKWDTRFMNFIFCHVHLCVWGGVCALLWVYCRCGCCCLAKSYLHGGVENNSNMMQDKDAEEGMQDVNGKKRKWNATNIYCSLENVVYLMRIHNLSQHRFPIFCGVILLLVC